MNSSISNIFGTNHNLAPKNIHSVNTYQSEDGKIVHDIENTYLIQPRDLVADKFHVFLPEGALNAAILAQSICETVLNSKNHLSKPEVDKITLLSSESGDLKTINIGWLRLPKQVIVSSVDSEGPTLHNIDNLIQSLGAELGVYRANPKEASFNLNPPKMFRLQTIQSNGIRTAVSWDCFNNSQGHSKDIEYTRIAEPGDTIGAVRSIFRRFKLELQHYS